MTERSSAEWNSYETHNIYPNVGVSLNDQQQFRLNKINEIKERELMSKGRSKYIGSFGYFDKLLIVLSVTTGSISIASFPTGTPIGMVSANFSLAFLISTETVRKQLKTTRNKKKKHNKIVMLARSKLNSRASEISETLINNDISHEDFMSIKNEEKTTEN